jgi:hypothetical protein
MHSDSVAFVVLAALFCIVVVLGGTIVGDMAREVTAMWHICK